MNPPKKSRRCRGFGLNLGLDLAISRFIYSFDYMSQVEGKHDEACIAMMNNFYADGAVRVHLLFTTNCIESID
jgi:hypothetical protein